MVGKDWSVCVFDSLVPLSLKGALSIDGLSDSVEEDTFG